MSDTTHARWIIEGVWRAKTPIAICNGETLYQNSEAFDESTVSIAQVELDTDKRPLIRARVQKGALRAWASKRLKPSAKSTFLRLFGTFPQENVTLGLQVPAGGCAQFGNAFCLADAEGITEAVASIAVNRRTGTAQPGALWTQRQVIPGVKFGCRHVLENASETDAALFIAALAQYSTESALGAGNGTGQGRVEWELHRVSRIGAEAWRRWWSQSTVKSVHWTDLIEDNTLDRAALNQFPGFGDFFEVDVPGRVALDLDLQFFEPFLHASRPDDEVARERVDVVARQASHVDKSDGFVPSLSARAVKGVLRSQAERIVCTLLDSEMTAAARAVITEIFGGAESGDGLLRIGTPRLSTETVPATTRHFVAIDRFTNGARRGALYQIRAGDKPNYIVPIQLTLQRQRPADDLVGQKPGPRTVHSRQLSAAALGLLQLLWRDWCEGDLRLGYKTTSGYGAHRVKLLGHKLSTDRDRLYSRSTVPVTSDDWHHAIGQVREYLADPPGSLPSADAVAKFIHAALLEGLDVSSDLPPPCIPIFDSPTCPEVTQTAALSLHPSIPAAHNPYFFVPLDGVEAQLTQGEGLSDTFVPAENFRKYALGVFGHDRYLRRHFSGKILIRILVEPTSGVFIGADRPQRKSQQDLLRAAGVANYTLVDRYTEMLEGQQVAAIPASTLKGNISTLHETITGSAMRVFEHDRPVTYRADVDRKESLPALGRLYWSKTKNRYLVRVLAVPGATGATAAVANKWLSVCPDKLHPSLLLRWKVLGKAEPAEQLIGKDNYLDLADLKRFDVRYGCTQVPISALQTSPEGMLEPIRVEIRSLYHSDRKDDLFAVEKRRALVVLSGRDKHRLIWETRQVSESALKEFNALILDIARQSKSNESSDNPFLWRPFMPVLGGGAATYKKQWRFNTRHGVWLPHLRRQEKDGCIVYFDMDSERSEITRLAFSSVWRTAPSVTRAGKSRVATVGDFVHAELQPMSASRKWITPTEHLFGFVESSGSDSSYGALKGRVHFSSALPLDKDDIAARKVPDEHWPKGGELTSRMRLKALGTPKPANPRFYFTTSDPNENEPDSKYDMARGDVHIRGRKVVLRGPGTAENEIAPGSTAAPYGDDKHAKLKMAIEPPVTGDFWCSIDFHNLSQGELEELVFCLRPSSNFVHQMGLGKSLGLGQVKVEPMVVSLVDRQRRYLGGAAGDNCRYHQHLVSAAWHKVQQDPMKLGQLQNRFPAMLDCLPDSAGAGGVASPAQLAQQAEQRLRENAKLSKALDILLAAGSRSAVAAAVRWPVTGKQIDSGDTENELYQWHSANKKGNGRARLATRLQHTKAGVSLVPLIWSVTPAWIKCSLPDRDLQDCLAVLGLRAKSVRSPASIIEFLLAATRGPLRGAILTSPESVSAVKERVVTALQNSRKTSSRWRPIADSTVFLTTREELIAWLAGGWRGAVSIQGQKSLSEFLDELGPADRDSEQEPSGRTAS